jgi:hypothetical protein
MGEKLDCLIHMLRKLYAFAQGNFEYNNNDNDIDLSTCSFMENG